MSETYTFLKKCGVFFVVTDNYGIPNSRPFDSLIENNNELIIGVMKVKETYRQLKIKSRIQIVAIDKDNDHWLRLNGIAIEEYSDELKEIVINNSDYLKSKKCKLDDVSIFKIEIMDYKIY